MSLDSQIRSIVRWCTANFDLLSFEPVANHLKRLEPETLPGDVLVAWLSATAPASIQLGTAREEFAARVRPRLVREFGEERVQRIYSRLG